MWLLGRPLVSKAITIPFNAPHDPFCQLLHCGYFLVSGGKGGSFTLLNKDGEAWLWSSGRGGFWLMKIAFYHNHSSGCFINLFIYLFKDKTVRVIKNSEEKNKYSESYTMSVKILIIL